MDEYEGLVLDDFVLNDLALVALGAAFVGVSAGLGMVLRLAAKRLYITYGRG